MDKVKERLLYTSRSHDKRALVSQFDAEQGYPTQLARVMDWPRIKWPDYKEVASLDTKGPLGTLVNMANQASPIKIPDFLLNLATNVLDKGLEKLINSCSLTQGFYNVGQMLRDYACGDLDKAEY